MSTGTIDTSIASVGKEPQVQRELKSLEGAIDTGLELQAQIKERLIPITTEELLDEEKGADRTALVPLAEALRVQTDRLITINDRYLSILNRLEL